MVDQIAQPSSFLQMSLRESVLRRRMEAIAIQEANRIIVELEDKGMDFVSAEKGFIHNALADALCRAITVERAAHKEDMSIIDKVIGLQLEMLKLASVSIIYDPANG